MGDKKDINQKIRVAQYLRMSTDHQKYSIDNQAAYLKKYADEHNMEITGTYDDEGKSGVSATGRNNFNRLIEDVVTGKINIEAVIVYDVSRFGRWQDSDEAGHYSYLLKYHGVRIIYCAENLPEGFPEIQMLTLPALRYAAGAYSRNLSVKVFAGHVNLVKRGYYQGGTPGYGLRRKLIDPGSKKTKILNPGERKSLQTDRVVLVPGTKKEIQIIKRIFNMFIFEYYNEYMISSKLNEEGIKYTNNSIWSSSKVHKILINERYLGNYIYNRTSTKLKSKRIKNPEEEWIRHTGFFTPIISPEKFSMAREIILNRSNHMTDKDILDYLRQKLDTKGKLSGFIIDEDNFGPSSSVVASRFGGLLNAYKLIGYSPGKDYSYIKINERLRNLHKDLLSQITENLTKAKFTVSESQLITINDNLKLSVIVSRCKARSSGSLRWVVRFDRSLEPDISIVVRMDSANSNPVDYYILPSFDIIESQLKLKETNTIILELYRFNDLNFFLEMLNPPTKKVA